MAMVGSQAEAAQPPALSSLGSAESCIPDVRWHESCQQADGEIRRPSALTACGRELSPCGTEKWRRFKLTIRVCFYWVCGFSGAPGMLHPKGSGDSGLAKPNLCLTDGLCVGRGHFLLSCGSPGLGIWLQVGFRFYLNLLCISSP